MLGVSSHLHQQYCSTQQRHAFSNTAQGLAAANHESYCHKLDSPFGCYIATSGIWQWCQTSSPISSSGEIWNAKSSALSCMGTLAVSFEGRLPNQSLQKYDFVEILQWQLAKKWHQKIHMKGHKIQIRIFSYAKCEILGVSCPPISIVFNTSPFSLQATVTPTHTNHSWGMNPRGHTMSENQGWALSHEWMCIHTKALLDPSHRFETFNKYPTHNRLGQRWWVLRCCYTFHEWKWNIL